MICCGEGGLLYTNNEIFFASAVRYHDFGEIRPYFAAQLTDPDLADARLGFPGNQYRLSEFQAAVMIAQFKKLEGLLQVCRAYYKQLEQAFQGLHFQLRLLGEGHCGITCFMKFATVDEVKQFFEALRAEGIPTGATSART